MNLLCCDSCSLVIDRAVWRQSANEIYEDEWFADNNDPVGSPWIRLFEYWNNARTFNHLRSIHLPGRRLLEIGVGSGSFLGYMRDRGFDVVGCDLSESICKRVTDKYQVFIHHGHVWDIPEIGRFDIVVMNHVLEHTSNPVNFLTCVKNKLNKSGVVHIAVPNINCWEAHLSGWNSYEPYHLLYFNPQSLRSIVQRAGFIIEHDSTRESFSGWFLALLRTAYGFGKHRAVDRYLKKKARAQSWIEHAYRFGMVTCGLVTTPLRAVQSWLGRGDEILVLARAENGC